MRQLPKVLRQVKTTEKIIRIFLILFLFVHTDCCPVLLVNVRPPFLIFSKIKIIYSVINVDKNKTKIDILTLHYPGFEMVLVIQGGSL